MQINQFIYLLIPLIMNYLAHAYLSFGIPDILTGNMISDFVKGKTQLLHTPAVQKGIMLHRDIDTFTDNHPQVKSAKEYFRKDYRLYSGAFVDVAFDHFVATDSTNFLSPAYLKQFTIGVYDHLIMNRLSLPERFQQILPYMVEQDWLYNYSAMWGIQKSFEGLVRRAAFIDDSSAAYRIFVENYEQLKNHYTGFFPELKKFVSEALTGIK
ncbi:acyl carrier protein phosphodiesterase [soil metagenome]